MRIHIGMRKVKSLIAVAISFIIWQLIRVFLPMLETHPIFAYVYSVVELRETAEKTKKFGKLRMRATFIGLIVGLIFITVSVFATSKIDEEIWHLITEFLIILIATLVSLVIADAAKCENFTGIAAIISIICMVSFNEEDVYLYAIMRAAQTLIGVLAAVSTNVYIKKRDK